MQAGGTTENLSRIHSIEVFSYIDLLSTKSAFCGQPISFIGVSPRKSTYGGETGFEIIVIFAVLKELAMKVLITGTSQGIGKAVAELFLEKGHDVVGIDRKASAIEHENYIHYVCDVRDWESLPEIDDVDILINNAGTQNEDDIDINLKSLIRITEKYGVRTGIKSILNIGSASGHTGSEFPEYCASKGGVIAYTKNVALRVAAFGATCNSLDPGGVLTPLNDCVVNDPVLWNEIMNQTPLKRWASVQEIAQWAIFLTVENKFATGQSIIVDGGESINFHFVWPK